MDYLLFKVDFFCVLCVIWFEMGLIEFWFVGEKWHKFIFMALFMLPSMRLISLRPMAVVQIFWAWYCFFFVFLSIWIWWFNCWFWVLTIFFYLNLKWMCFSFVLQMIELKRIFWWWWWMDDWFDVSKVKWTLLCIGGSVICLETVDI